MRTISLRTRLTLLTIALLAIMAVILTFASLYNAESIFGTAQTVSDDGDTDGQNVPYSEASAVDEVGQFRNVSVLLMVAVIVLGGGLAYGLAWLALWPMGQLNRQIQGISANRLDARIQVPRSSEEIAQLADSFNAMLDRLEEAFGAQRRFASAAAHELKTPLAAIRTNLEVLTLDDSADMEEYETVYAVIAKQTGRMSELVDSLLATAASQDYPMEDIVLLDELVQDIVNEQGAAIGEKALTVTLNCAPSLLVAANTPMLYRALANVVENAVKYNIPGGALSLNLEGQRHMAKLQVVNTGPAIGPEHLPHIFAPFYRVDPSRSRKIGGAGLGLSIAKDTVERHGGTITVDSGDSRTVCTILLPLAQ